MTIKDLLFSGRAVDPRTYGIQHIEIPCTVWANPNEDAYADIYNHY